jgi:hypothetical protein
LRASPAALLKKRPNIFTPDVRSLIRIAFA